MIIKISQNEAKNILKHPLSEKFSTPASELLDAIASGDVAGEVGFDYKPDKALLDQILGENFVAAIQAAARKFTDDNFNSPTDSDYLVVHNAFLRGSKMGVEFTERLYKR